MEFINSGITVFGFIVSFFLLRSSFSQEIQKQKTDIYLNQLSEMPMTILKMLDSVIFKQKPQDDLASDIRDISNRIMAYGTADAVRIAAKMFEFSYNNHDKTGTEKDIYSITAIYVLLFCQLKYDLTNIWISPENYYRTKIKDYTSEYREIYLRANDNLVKELRLDRNLLFTAQW